MTGVLYAIAQFCVRRRFVVLAVWVLAAVALVAISHRLSDNTSDNLKLPGTDSQRATDALNHSFAAQSNGSSPIVLHVNGGKLTDSKYSSAVNEAAADVSKAPHVASVVNPLTSQGASALSKDKATGYLTVTTSVSAGTLSVDDAQTIIDAAAKPAQKAGIEVQTGGQLGQKVSKPSTESSELIGILAAMVILALTFGTAVAMFLPIVNAILALVATLAIIRMLSHVTTVSSVAPTLATMIGLGVGIDYALFIVTRHFRGLNDGLDLRESIARATATSGGAVVFAGSTVTIALVSLAVADIPLVTTMGLMAAIAVVVAVLAAVTLLPATLAIVGPRINSLRVRGRHTDTHPKRGLWARWASGVASHPVVAGVAALAILLPLAIPLLSLHLGQKDVAALSKSTTARQAYDLVSKNFGAGVNGPLIVAVSLGSPAKSSSDSRLATLQKDVSQTSGVAAVTPVQVDKAGTTAFFNAIPTKGPAETATTDLVNNLRGSVIPKAEHGTNMKAYVGGTTAAYVDLAANISSKLPLQIVVVIALSFILLTLAFRTVTVPVQAAVMNVLSIAAAYGVLTAIFQFGWLHSVIGLESSVEIVSYVPLFMFAVLFGLSMDYEVFLVSQIEEHVHAGEDNKQSVVSGLVTSARVITAAALIMVFVFGSFVLNGDPTVKQFGIGLAVAAILDATIVRCLLVPALMVVMGKVNWYMPRWLDRLLPRVSIEGAEVLQGPGPPPSGGARPGARSARQRGGFVTRSLQTPERTVTVEPISGVSRGRRRPGVQRGRNVLAFAAALLLGGLALAPAGVAAAPAKLTFTMVRVGSPGNRAVGIIPFKDAIFPSCSVAPKTPARCLTVGSVGYRYEIGELEVTVAQWVAFLNTVDPGGTDRHGLYDSSESSSVWPRFGEINLVARARPGFHYRVAYPEWADKPYGFARSFLRAARFVNSLTNGKVLSRRTRRSGGFSFVTLTVRLSRQTERGMYDLARREATRDRKRGFVVPSQNEWIKAAYFDPRGGGTLSYWKYPTNPGVFFKGGMADAPTATALNPQTGDVTNAATQPLANYKPSNGPVPYWCPSQVSATDCQTVNPFGLDPTTYAALYQGSLSTVGQARTRSPWGTLDQGGNAVEWTDTVTAPPFGAPGRRVWRRLHGGVPNASAYQMWISAVGLQPQDNTVFSQTYPWVGFRIGFIG